MLSNKKTVRGLGERLRYLRESRGMTVEAVAYELGCRVDEYEGLESGVAEGGQTHLVKIHKFSQLVGVSVGVLVEGAEYADAESLFSMQRQDAEDFAASVLKNLKPEPLVSDFIDVQRVIRAKYDRFLAEKGEEVIAWRKDDKFSVDELEVLAILKLVRANRNKGGMSNGK